MKKKLKIVFVDFDDIKNPLLAAGQARSTYEVAKRLVLMGHKITVLSSRYPGYKDRIQSGIRYKHIGLGTRNIRLNNAAFIFSIPFSIRRMKAEIIVECFTAPISTLLTPLYTRIPVIGKSTSFDAAEFSKVYHLPFHYIESIGARFYKYFIATSEYYQKKMNYLNPSVISTVVSEGVSKEYFSIRPKQGKYILFLGRLDIHQKGIDLLLQSYAKVCDRVSLPLVIAGHGPDVQKVRELVDRQGLQDKVFLVGSAYGAKKKKLLEHAAAVALPSRHEGFSIITLEAFASGLPVLMFDISSLSWVKKAVVKKAKPYDIKDYAQLIMTYCDQSKNRENSVSYKNFAKDFSWESVALQYAAFIDRIMRTRPSTVSNTRKKIIGKAIFAKS